MNSSIDDAFNETSTIEIIIEETHADAVMDPCEERQLYKILIGYGFIFIFLFAVFGNFVNLLIYNSDHIKYYIAIRMLCTRLLMNSLTLIFMVPRALRIISVWSAGSRIDHAYWFYYPYQLYFVNLFGFCSMWLTVMMTAECYLHVFLPSHSKVLCTKRNLSRSYIVIISTGAVLYLLNFFNRNYSLVEECDRTVVYIHAPDDFIMVLIEKIHTVASLFLAIVIPMGLLVFMASSILWKLVLRKTEFTSHFTSEKRCVTRITLITTILQLIAELPCIPVFIYATISGPDAINGSLICIWNTIGSFLGLCNISLSFFVYLVFSDKFRNMVKSRFTELFHPCTTNTAFVSYQNEAGANSNLLLTREAQSMQSQEPECVLLSPFSTNDDISACCTDSCLLNDRSSVNDDSYL
ncbi:unnamed protein product [Caenorhabditis bovis]|uniref:G-protein coupled receptors family 1 profile domain-containing protein n=1 Tax=Caenorhabditis bovis TaxID=2654633 RepID=A0A8S1FB45_9PELO|nr:unnamed protein product [Caenorhabditis bovis]